MRRRRHRLGARSSLALAGQTSSSPSRPSYRQGKQRRRVRLRLELGRLRAARRHSLLPEGRRRGALHAGHGRSRARRPGRRPRAGDAHRRPRRARLVRARQGLERARSLPARRRGEATGRPAGIFGATAFSFTGSARAPRTFDEYLARFSVEAAKPDQARAPRRARGGDRRRDPARRRRTRAKWRARCTRSTPRPSTSTASGGACT